MKSSPPWRAQRPRWRAGPPPVPLIQSILDPGAPNPDGRHEAAVNGFCFYSTLPGLDPPSLLGFPDTFSGLFSLQVLPSRHPGSSIPGGDQRPDASMLAINLPREAGWLN